MTKLTKKTQIELLNKLSSLLHAQIPILTALELLKSHGSHKYQQLFTSIIENISQGKTFSSTLKQHTNFDPFVISMIHIGETRGMLNKNIKHVIDELKKQDQLKRSLISAFIYPGFIAGATLFLSGFLLLYIFPKIQPVLKTVSAELPLNTRILIGLSSLLKNYGIYMLILSIVSIISFIFFRKRYFAFNFWIDKTLLKIPVLKTIIIKYEIARGFKSLGLMYGSGAPLPEALKAAKNTTNNTCIKETYEDSYVRTQDGILLSQVFREHSTTIPLQVSELVSIAESTGTLAETCIAISQMYEQDLESFTKKLSQILEPVLMILMGCIVGFIALSMITPIYSISQKLQR